MEDNEYPAQPGIDFEHNKGISYIYLYILSRYPDFHGSGDSKRN